MNAKASLAVALLTLFVAVVAHEHPKELQHECIQGTPAIAALQQRGLTKKVQKTTSGRHFGAKSFAPLRIVTSTLDLYDPSQYCTQAGDVRKDFQGDDLVCTDGDVLTDDKRNKILELIPLGVARLKQLYAVDRVTSPIQVGDGFCENVTTPANHTDPGVSDADFVLYITAGPTRGGTIAWAYTCSYDDFGRPLIGQANFGPGSIPIPSTPDLDTQVLNVFIHESTHALGYNKYFWFSPFWAGDNVVINATVRGHPTQVFSGAAVVQHARAFFGCKTLFYVDLENEGGPGSLFMHWDRHTLQQELMCAAGGSKYSVFTLAALEDSGHYAPYYSNADDMDWGKGAGCGFVTESCAKTSGGKGSYFCFDETGGDYCTYNNKAIGYCGVSPFSGPIPSWGQYFYDTYVGGSSNFMDYCPVVKPYQNRDCTAQRDPTDAEATFGFSFGEDSRCFRTHSENGEAFGLLSTSGDSGAESGYRCLRRRCTGYHQLEVLVGDQWLQCGDRDGMIYLSNYDVGFNGAIFCGQEWKTCTGNPLPPSQDPSNQYNGFHTPIPATVPPIPNGGCSSPTNGQTFVDSGEIMTDLDGIGGVLYQANENCAWTIQCSNPGTYLYISDLALRTEDGFDYIRFEVQSKGNVQGKRFDALGSTTLLVQYSGAYMTPNVIGALPGKPSLVTVRFVSDDAGELNGATLKFHCAADGGIPTEAQCDNADGATQRTYVSMSGKVESDVDGAGPQVYINQPYCVWKIRCPPDAQMYFSSLRGVLADDDMIVLDSGDNPFEQALGSWGPLSYTDTVPYSAISVTLLNAFSASNSGGTAGFTLYYTCMLSDDSDKYCYSVNILSVTAPNDSAGNTNAPLVIDGILESGYTSQVSGPFTLVAQLAGSFSVDNVYFYASDSNGHGITHTVSYSTDGGQTYTVAGTYHSKADSEFGSVAVGVSGGVTHIKFDSDNDIDHQGDGYYEVFVCGRIDEQPSVRTTPHPTTAVPTPTTCFSSSTHGTYYYDLNGTVISDTDGAGPAPYASNDLCNWYISCPAGATPFIDSAYGHTEQGYDFVYFKNPDTGETYINLTGGFNWTEANYGLVIGTFYDTPGTVEVQLASDYATNDAGFTVDYTCVSQATFSKWSGALGRGSANRSALFLGGAIIRGTEVKGQVVRGTITRGTITRGTMTRGTIIRGTIVRSGITRGTIIRGTITRGTITRGTITRGTITRGTITRGTITRGTPICMTYDGCEYQCDYWGEALIANCQRPSDISPNALIIHARAEPPFEGAQHTVVTGIAIKDGDLLVSFERDLGTGEITTTLNGIPQTGNLSTGAMYVLYWPDATIEIYSFVDYSKVVVDPHPNTISYQTILSEYCMDYTFGLIGNFDVDPYNDFQSLDLSITLPIDAPQSDIYQYFILSYLVTDDSESLFPIFTPPHLDFVPQFITDDMIFNCPDFCNQEAGCCYTAAVAGDAVASEDLQSISFSLQTSSNDICTTVLDTCEVWIMGKCVCDTTQAPESFCTEYVANCLAVESACLAVANACFDAVGRCFTNGNNGSPIPVPI